jgi:hypothetical protein
MTTTNQRAVEKLLPCPFCESTDLDVEWKWVECNRCSTFGPTTDGDPIAAWNRRIRPRWQAACAGEEE